MSAVVLHELLVRANDQHARHLLERRYATEFHKRGRLLVPSEWVWRRAAEADRKLRASRRSEKKLAHRSFANDLLIALTCREIDAILLTSGRHGRSLCTPYSGSRLMHAMFGAASSDRDSPRASPCSRPAGWPDGAGTRRAVRPSRYASARSGFPGCEGAAAGGALGWRLGPIWAHPGNPWVVRVSEVHESSVGLEER
jgi:predicted nucleic acid-binding protein